MTNTLSKLGAAFAVGLVGATFGSGAYFITHVGDFTKNFNSCMSEYGKINTPACQTLVGDARTGVIASTLGGGILGAAGGLVLITRKRKDDPRPL